MAMKKRSRKRPKRSGKRHDRQQRQQLSREVRELYEASSTDPDAETDWHAALAADLEPPLHRRGPRPPTATPEADRAGRAGTVEDAEAEGPEHRGTVVAIFSGACQVDDGDQVVDCVLPSELARDQQAAVAVGDEVDFTEHGAHDHRLLRVLPRRSTLSRPDPQNPHRERVIAANVDVAVHVASVIEPPLRPALVDRYLIAIERGGAQAAVCVNKIDLLPDAEDRSRELAVLAPYRELGVEILTCSARTGEGLPELRALLRGRTAVLAGHSGVGKSSLLNALDPDADADTGRLHARLGTGRHTTARSNLYRLADGVRIIDTPGIRELGLWRLTPSEARSCFPDVAHHAAGCRFADCLHRHEPDCAVQAAVAGGELARARYAAYLRILDSLAED